MKVDNKPFTSGLFILVAVAATSLLPTSASGASWMTGAEIREVLIGNSIEMGDGNIRIYFDPSGEGRAHEGLVKDRGDWEIFDDHYCMRWDNFVDNKLLCWKIKWKVKGKVLSREGVKGTTFDNDVNYLQGNPAEL